MSEAVLPSSLAGEKLLLQRCLFCALECSSLYLFDLEISVEFDTKLKAIECQVSDVALALLQAGYVELFFASKERGDKLLWTKLPNLKWLATLANSRNWLPELEGGGHYELGITEQGKVFLAQLTADRRGEREVP